MKLLTLNAHSLQEEKFPGQTEKLAEFLLRETPDLVALQEVNQRTAAPRLPAGRREDFVFCAGEAPLRTDNFAVALVETMKKRGTSYFYTWLPVKRGYGIFDEGLAFLSKSPLTEAYGFHLTNSRDYANWRTRMALCVRVEEREPLFCCTHTGWWQDGEEPFLRQWEALMERLPREETVWLMGDFNNPAELRGEGYDRMLLSGWYDSYRLAPTPRGEETVRGVIDGWQGRTVGRDCFRIDHLWCNRPVAVIDYRTVLDGRDGPVVSDHFGVMITVDHS